MRNRTSSLNSKPSVRTREQIPKTMKGKCILFILIVTVTLVKAPGGGGGKQKSDFGYSKEDQFDNPDYFWPISSSLHGNSAPASSLTATLHQTTLDTGEADLNSVNFDGTSQSFMTIPNNGALDGAIAFCWVFNLYPAKEQTATILEYGGLGETGNGVKLTQMGTFLAVSLYDETGAFVIEYQENVLTINSWNFVGFSYNNDWGHVDIIKGNSLTYTDISQKDLLVNAVGDVTIGNSPDGSAPFEGKISCIQFYPKALFNNALNNPPSYCSLSQWTDTSILDWTDTFVPTTTTTTTTPTPTTSPTTVSTTTTTTTTPIPTTSPTTVSTTTTTTTTPIPTTSPTTVSTTTTTTTTPIPTTSPTTVSTTTTTTTTPIPTTSPTTVSTTTTTTTTPIPTTSPTTVSTTTTTTPIPTTSPTTVSTTSTTTTTTTTTPTVTTTTTTYIPTTTFPTTVSPSTTSTTTTTTTYIPTTTFPKTVSTSSTSTTTTTPIPTSTNSITTMALQTSASTTTETSTMTSPQTTTATTTTTPEMSTTETTGTSPPSTSPRTATRGNQRFPQDICHSFNHMGYRQNIPMSDVISMTSKSTVTNCAQMCTSLVDCVTFSFSSETNDCRLSDVTSPALEPSLDPALSVYALKTIDRNRYVQG